MKGNYIRVKNFIVFNRRETNERDSVLEIVNRMIGTDGWESNERLCLRCNWNAYRGDKFGLLKDSDNASKCAGTCLSLLGIR